MRGAASIAILLSAGMLQAQQDVFRSKLTVQAGLVRSLGDVTSGLETFDPERTAMLGVSYERFLSYGVSLYGGYEHLRLSGNDRDSGLKDRSLNFLAKVNTAQLGLRFYADNGSLLNYDARFAPFLQLGIGVGAYDVYGDLYDASGARYNYWSDGTIRTLPEGAPDAASAQLMEQDGVFETRLTDLATEEDKPRDALFMFVPARLGLKWRISECFSAELAYAFNWTFTDHLDDVSRDYPASYATEELAYISNPAGHDGPRGNNGQNDHFHHLSLGLSMGIGRRSHKFRMPPVRAMAPDAVKTERTVAIPDTMPPIAKVAEAPVPDSLPAKWTIVVESIRIERLEVDTIVLRGPSVQDTMITGKSTAPADTTLGKAAEPRKGLEHSQDTTVAVPADTLRRISLDALQTRSQGDTLERRPLLDTLQRRAPEDTLHRGALIDTLVQRSSLTHTLQRSSIELEADTVVLPRSAEVQAGEGAQAGAGTREQEPEERTVQRTGEPRSTTTEGGTIERVTTERIIERTAPPVVVVQKEVVRDTIVKQVPVVVGDTMPMKTDTAAVAPKDSLAKATRTPLAPSPARSEHTPQVRSALEMQRDHAMQMNRMLNDRIRTLETYVAIQEEHGGAADVDSLRRRIATLDSELKVLRAGETAPRADDVPAAGMAIMDTVRFASESFQVGHGYRESLEATAKRIIEQDARKVLVTGHTDRSGDAEYNRRLSQRRAEAVAEVLRAAGVPKDRITAKGLGQELASERHDRNERVVVVQVAQPE